MSKERYQIKRVDSWPVEEIVRLYRAGGWWKDTYDSSGIPALIQGSFLFAVVVDSETGEAIGMGRVLSDGVSDAYIQDFIILPDYRRSGIGKRLIEFLVTLCLSKGISWIGLLAEPGSETFYSVSGFHALSGYTPMKYHKED
ncbi:MAG: GNAT family N-acetyltransferase [Methanobacteriota archaeon]